MVGEGRLSRGRSFDMRPWPMMFVLAASCSQAGSRRAEAVVEDPPPALAALRPEGIAACLRYPGPLVLGGHPLPIRASDVISVALGRVPTSHALAPHSQEFDLYFTRGLADVRADLDAAVSPSDDPPAPFTEHARITPFAGGARGEVGLMMAGELVWATVSSPHRTYSLTLLFEAPLHDSVHGSDPGGEARFRSVKTLLALRAEGGLLEDALECLTKAAWPPS